MDYSYSYPPNDPYMQPRPYDDTDIFSQFV